MSTSKFVLLYSIYSWPNVILCFIGGFLLDSVFGIRLGTVIYMGLTLIGQIVFATGAIIDAFWLMMVGRFIFGYVFIERFLLSQKMHAEILCMFSSEKSRTNSIAFFSLQYWRGIVGSCPE